MIGIGVLGYGVVGSGVVELLQKNMDNFRTKINKEVSVKKILVRNPGKYMDNNHLLTDRIDEIMMEDVDIIVEVMGGLDPAYDYVKRALMMKKHVVTANKDLIAAYGDELTELADNNGVSLFYEASVGGGIPIIRPMSEYLASNEISQIMGILNGTTNFILSKMFKENMKYKEALAEAQRLGFAEANPESDVMGYDAARKLSILSSIAYHKKIDWQEMNIEGIANIDEYDIKYARKLGCRIKLLAFSNIINQQVFASVRPVMVNADSSIAKIENEFNGIIVQGDAIGSMMFTGKGAGKLPTASAVVGDILNILQNHKLTRGFQKNEKADISNLWNQPGEWLLRIDSDDRYATMGHVGGIFQENYFLVEDTKHRDEIVVLVKAENEQNLNNMLEGLKAISPVKSIKKMIKLGEEIA